VDVLDLRDQAARRYEEFVATLEAMVNVDCGSFTRKGVNHIDRSGGSRSSATSSSAGCAAPAVPTSS
jgi:hypothetical protein